MKERRPGTECSECPRQCSICGRCEHLEQNHLGSWKDAPFLFLPFCKPDHARFHVLCARAGVDFKSRPANRTLALIRVLKAIWVATWMVLGMLEKIENDKLEKTPTDGQQP